jgi:hypothetical protein
MESVRHALGALSREEGRVKEAVPLYAADSGLSKDVLGTKRRRLKWPDQISRLQLELHISSQLQQCTSELEKALSSAVQLY